MAGRESPSLLVQTLAHALPWFLIAVVLQALVIAGLLVEWTRRRRADRVLGERLQLERLVAEVSARLIPVALSDLDAEIARGLERAAAFLRMDRASLGERVSGAPIVRVAWTEAGCAGAVPVPEVDRFPWTTADLAIARSIVGVHGGRLTARNNPEGGATLSFTLPVRDPRA